VLTALALALVAATAWLNAADREGAPAAAAAVKPPGRPTGEQPTGDAAPPAAAKAAPPGGPSVVAATDALARGRYACADIPLRLLEPPGPGGAADEKANPHGLKPCCPMVMSRHEHHNGVSKSTTLVHYLSRFACHSAELRAAFGGAGERLRVLRIGANFGQNLFGSDMLAALFRDGFAEGVLVEPVPWLFAKLRANFEGPAGRDGGTTSSSATAASQVPNVAFVNAAVDATDGVRRFFAPKPSALHKYWWFEMGGFDPPAKSVEEVSLKKGLDHFEWIYVPTLSVPSLLRLPSFTPAGGAINGAAAAAAAPTASAALWPHAVLVDTEGHDGAIVTQLLDAMVAADAIVPFVQFEAKHLPPRNVSLLLRRLGRLGYCSLRVDDDYLSYHLWSNRASPPLCATAVRIDRFERGAAAQAPP